MDQCYKTILFQQYYTIEAVREFQLNWALCNRKKV